MNKRALDGFWDQFRQKYGVYLRLLDLMPADSYQTEPVPGLRSAAELAVPYGFAHGAVFRRLVARR